MRILTGGHNDSPHTHVLHQLYLVYGESRQNMGWYYCWRCSKSTLTTNAFWLGGLAFIMKKSEPLIIKEFGQGFYAVLSFTGQQYIGITYASITEKLFQTLATLLVLELEWCKLVFSHKNSSFSFVAILQGKGTTLLQLLQYVFYRMLTNKLLCIQREKAAHFS